MRRRDSWIGVGVVALAVWLGGLTHPILLPLNGCFTHILRDSLDTLRRNNAGQQFVITQDSGFSFIINPAAPPPLAVVLNWIDESQATGAGKIA